MIRILIIDQVLLVCEVIAAVLEDESDVLSTGIATDVDGALAQLASSKLNMALVSTNLPDGHALNLVGCISEQYPDVKVIVLGIADSEAVILRYIEAGAVGYIFREDSAEEMLKNIRAAYHGKALVSPEVAATLMERLSQLSAQLTEVGTDPSMYEELTPREKEILDLIAEGLTNQELAKALTVELGTVKNHVHNILNKLNVNSRKDAAAFLALVQAEEANGGDCG